MINIYNLSLDWKGDIQDTYLGLAPIQAYIEADEADAACKVEAKKRGVAAPKGLMERLTPVLHKDAKFQPFSIAYTEGADKAQLVAETFKKLVTENKQHNFPFGKQLTVVDNVANKTLVVTSIDDKQFVLPAFAADFVPIVKGTKDGKDVYYFVGIVRANPPGKGQLATAGGFCNVKKSKETGIEVFSSLMHTALSEGKQEIRSKIETEIPLAQLKTDYDVKSLKGTIEFEGKKLPCQIVHTSTFPTSDKLLPQGGEQIPQAEGHKRVHVAASIGIYYEVPNDINLTADVVLRNFKANSDASDLTVLDVTDAVMASGDADHAFTAAKGIHDTNKMGIDHHREILQHGLLGANRHFVQKLPENPIKALNEAQAELKKVKGQYEAAMRELNALKAKKDDISLEDKKVTLEKPLSKRSWKQLFTSCFAWIKSCFTWTTK